MAKFQVRGGLNCLTLTHTHRRCSLIKAVRGGFLEKPIYSAMVHKLYRHYHRDIGIEERFTDQQLQEQEKFIDLLAESPIILETKSWLACRGKLF